MIATEPIRQNAFMFGDSKPGQQVKRRMSNIERLNPREEIKFEANKAGVAG